ncbi:Putrescine aminotransferase [bacterium HR17]|uniref:Putrescine aminotransferase n=1 Tax=Candidatus Fervidibacter japonicus TaxID=2035412 RepID=A0A2H5X9E5_9BACT|nr:Putrescine aminotransferase [bacterium HR17]
MAAVNERVARLYAEHLNPGLARLMKFAGLDAVEHRAEGVWVYDHDGNRYLDFLGGFGALNFGHRHPAIVAAVQAQLQTMPLSSRVLFNELQAELAAQLAAIAPGDLQFCFFCHSGTEAVEACIKFARLATGRRKIVAMHNAYHGKTLGALSASGREIYRQPFEPLLEWFVHVPFGDAGAVAQAVDDDTAAVIVEPIQGEGGVIVPPDDFLPKVREICDRAGALLIADEVQTGLGRTGKNFAVEHWQVIPDVMALAKSLGGGVMPLGAAIGTRRVFEPLFDNPLLHSSTLGGNPLACAAGLAALQVLQQGRLADRAAATGDLLLQGLHQLHAAFADLIVAVRGKGLLVGIEFADADIALLTAAGMLQRRVLTAYTLNNPCVIRLEPPLIVEPEHIDLALSALADSLAQVRQLLSVLR